MAVSYWWFACLVSDDDHRRIAPAFAEAQKKAVLSKSSMLAIDAWRRVPTQLDVDQAIDGDLYNAVSGAFTLSGFEDFAAQFCTRAGRFSEFLSADTCVRSAALRRCTPFAAMLRALGDRAMSLPGTFGNLLVRADEVTTALARTNRAFEGLSIDHLVKEAMALVSHSNEESGVREVVTLLPEGLARAHELGVGFLAFTGFQS